jgi:PKD repeat protein
MGDGTTYNDTTPSHSYTEAGTFTIYLTAFSENGDCSSQTSFEVVSNWVRVEEFSGTILNAFPNPTSDKLIISSKHKVLFYSISDALGRVVKSADEINSNKFEIDVRSLNNGVYSISVQSENGQGLVRVVKN